MDDEWDLHAVVRSCNTISCTNTTTTIDDYDDDDGFDNMEIVTSRNDANPFSYSTSSENPSEGLEDVYKEGCSIVTPLAPTQTTAFVYVDEEDELPVMDASHSFSIETPSRKR